jgi:hypothetical protein
VVVLPYPKYLIKVSENQAQSIALSVEFGILKSSEKQKPVAARQGHNGEEQPGFR